MRDSHADPVSKGEGVLRSSMPAEPSVIGVLVQCWIPHAARVNRDTQALGRTEPSGKCDGVLDLATHRSSMMWRGDVDLLVLDSTFDNDGRKEQNSPMLLGFKRCESLMTLPSSFVSYNDVFFQR